MSETARTKRCLQPTASSSGVVGLCGSLWYLRLTERSFLSLFFCSDSNSWSVAPLVLYQIAFVGIHAVFMDELFFKLFFFFRLQFGAVLWRRLHFSKCSSPINPSLGVLVPPLRTCCP
ncbi:hypothetical protein CEXT_698621 [Caerostris extrusa]|uniref:Uncharacterized protein n=1 Tax=Caerostris extrusa TaxID=172846 RepID=A0AAV4T1D1_CAEEX|nr:hypothetical protein CEXT_698621 [Caerostris extrusa]